ncbi:Uncharacterised protein [Chlamydia abortus]|nr:Uncharacterised protein [Chlamydia abortus]
MFEASNKPLAIPNLIAPACPVRPPPLTLTIMSNVFCVPVTSNGLKASLIKISEFKYCLASLVLIKNLPVPGFIYTLATEDFLLPKP